MPYLTTCPACHQVLPPPAHDDDTLCCYHCGAVTDLRAPSEADRAALAAVVDLLRELAARRRARVEAQEDAAR